MATAFAATTMSGLPITARPSKFLHLADPRCRIGESPLDARRSSATDELDRQTNAKNLCNFPAVLHRLKAVGLQALLKHVGSSLNWTGAPFFTSASARSAHSSRQADRAYGTGFINALICNGAPRRHDPDSGGFAGGSGSPPLKSGDVVLTAQVSTDIAVVNAGPQPIRRTEYPRSPRARPSLVRGALRRPRGAPSWFVRAPEAATGSAHKRPTTRRGAQPGENASSLNVGVYWPTGSRVGKRAPPWCRCIVRRTDVRYAADYLLQARRAGY